MTVAVFGATGQLGHLVVEALLARGADAAGIIAIGRNAERLAQLESTGVRVRRADYAEPESLHGSLDGVRSVLLISGNEVGRRVEQHQRVIDEAVRAGVERIAYTSLLHADTSALPLAPEHKATEEALTASGLTAAFLRNGWYNENHRAEFDRARDGGVIANSIAAGRIASAARRDYAEAAAVVLLDPAHAGTTHELSGDVAWNFEEFALAAQEVLGTPVRYQPLTAEEEQTALREAGLAEGGAAFVGALNAGIRQGLLGDTPGDLARLIGRPTTPILDTLRSWL